MDNNGHQISEKDGDIVYDPECDVCLKGVFPIDPDDHLITGEIIPPDVPMKMPPLKREEGE